MFKFKKKESQLDAEIKRVLSKFDTLSAETQSYTIAATNLDLLYKCKSYKNDFSVDWNTIVLAGVSLLQILLVLNHESLGPISKNAIGFVSKLLR